MSVFQTHRPTLQTVPLLIYAASAAALMGAAYVSPILPLIQRDLGLSSSEIALMMTFFTLPVVVTAPILGWLTNHVGRREILSVSLLLFGLAGYGIYFVHDFRGILVLRFLQGVGFSGIMPVTVTLLGDMFGGETEVGAQGLRVSTISSASFVYPIVAGALAGIAWQASFLLFLLPVPLAIGVLYWVPDDSDSEESETTTNYLQTLLKSIKQPLIAGSLVVGFVRFFIKYGMLTFLPILVASHGISSGQTGLVIGGTTSMMIVVSMQSHRVYNLAEPWVVIPLSMLASGIFVSMFAFADALVAFILIAVLYSAAEGILAPYYRSLLTQTTSYEMRAGVVSLNAVLQSSGKTAGPIVVAVVVNSLDVATSFVFMGALYVFTSLSLFGIFVVAVNR